MKLTKIQYLNEFDVMLAFEDTIPSDTKVYVNNVPVAAQSVYQTPTDYVLAEGQSNYGILGWSFKDENFTFGNSFEVKNSAETLVVSNYGNGFYTESNGDVVNY